MAAGPGDAIGPVATAPRPLAGAAALSEAVALFGTSADPPTRGHRALLEGLLRLFPHVSTWASDNPLKRQQAPLEVRTALLRALVETIGDDRLELVQELSSPWAVETLQRAARRWPERPLVFVVGSDLVAQIPRWKQAEEVLRRCRLAIAPRRGWPLRQSDLQRLRSLGADPEVLPLDIPATASSEVRQQPDPDLVPRELWPVLLEHNLYGLTPP